MIIMHQTILLWPLLFCAEVRLIDCFIIWAQIHHHNFSTSRDVHLKSYDQKLSLILLNISQPIFFIFFGCSYPPYRATPSCCDDGGDLPSLLSGSDPAINLAHYSLSIFFLSRTSVSQPFIVWGARTIFLIKYLIVHFIDA